MVKKVPFLFLLFFFGIYSCRKDSSPDYPSVQISSPYSLATFNVPGNIYVTGHASDSKSLTSLSVNITNGQNQPVEQSIPITITSNNMNFSCTYELNDIHMPSGQYYLTVTASNGMNIASAFQEIYIDALPAKRTAIYAVSRTGAGIRVWKIDSVFHASPSPVLTVSGDYSSSDINSYYQQLYIAGHDSGNVNVYSVPGLSGQWTLPGVSAPQPYFTNVYCNNDAEFVSYYNPASVKCYNHNGAIQPIFVDSVGGYYPIKTFIWGQCLFVEEKSFSSAQEALCPFLESTTLALPQATLPGPVVAMFGYDNNDIFVFGNTTTGSGYMYLYNIPGNIFTPVSLTTTSKLLSVAQVNSNTYLMGFNNGIMYQYGYNINGMVPYINGINASTIRYDSINTQFIASTGNIINEYNYSFTTPSLAASATISDNILDLRILYNK